MANTLYQSIFLPQIENIKTIDDVRDVLLDLLDDINARFESIYSDTTGQGDSISNTALTYSTGSLAATPALGTGVLFKLSATKNSTIPGFSGGYGGRVVVVQNSSAYTYTIPSECGSALPAHRLISRTGADVTMGSGSGLVLLYDNVQNRWTPVCAQL